VTHPEVVGQPDPVLLDAAQRAAEVLSALTHIEGGILEMADIGDASSRRRAATNLTSHLRGLRDLLRPVAGLDREARQRALFDETETAGRVALAIAGHREPHPCWVAHGDTLFVLGTLFILEVPEDPAQIVGAQVTHYRSTGDYAWSLTVPGCDGACGNHGNETSLVAAQLAAEDALRAHRDAITRVVGR
jgi:hypothetical protein